jgi:hypothetical protein
MSEWLRGVLIAACMCAPGLLVPIVYVLHRRAEDRRQRERIARARLQATKLVIDFEHTPVRGASRDRSVPGKARRQARRGATSDRVYVDELRDWRG